MQSRSIDFEEDKVDSDITSIARNIQKEHNPNDLCTEHVKYSSFIF